MMAAPPVAEDWYITFLVHSRLFNTSSAFEVRQGEALQFEARQFEARQLEALRLGKLDH